MGSVSTAEFRKRLKVLIDGQPYIIVENEFVKPGKGQAFSRVKLKNLITGRNLERTFKSGETVEEADVTNHQMQFLYVQGTTYTFMDDKTFEQVEVPAEQIEEERKFLKENVMCEMGFWNNRCLSLELPAFMDFTVTYTEPAVRGDTATSVTKKATIETGAEIDVPPFVEQGTKIRVDTRTGEYLQRVT